MILKNFVISCAFMPYAMILSFFFSLNNLQKLQDGRYIPAAVFLTLKRVGKTDESTPVVKFLPNFTEAREPLGRGFTLSASTFIRLYESMFLSPSLGHSATSDVEALERELNGSSTSTDQVSNNTKHTPTTHNAHTTN